MKKIIFIRHGKAEDPLQKISDFERSLTYKGKILSKKMAEIFKDKENDPGIFVTSPAFRALETALIFAAEFNIKPEEIIIRSKIYYRMNLQYIHELTALVNEEVNSITLFGHNPSFTDLANTLCREGCDFMPKTGIIGISFNVMTWSDIKPNKGTLDYFLKPEKLL